MVSSTDTGEAHAIGWRQETSPRQDGHSGGSSRAGRPALLALPHARSGRCPVEGPSGQPGPFRQLPGQRQGCCDLPVLIDHQHQIQIGSTTVTSTSPTTVSLGLRYTAAGKPVAVLPTNGTQALQSPAIPLPGGLTGISGLSGGALAVTVTPQLVGLPSVNLGNLLERQSPGPDPSHRRPGEHALRGAGVGLHDRRCSRSHHAQPDDRKRRSPRRPTHPSRERRARRRAHPRV